MAVVSGISITREQAEEFRHVGFPEELHLVEEPDGRWTIDNGDCIVVEFVAEEEFEYIRVCPVCAKPLQNERIDEHGEESGAHGEEHMADCPAHGTWHWDDEGYWEEGG